MSRKNKLTRHFTADGVVYQLCLLEITDTHPDGKPLAGIIHPLNKEFLDVTGRTFVNTYLPRAVLQQGAAKAKFGASTFSFAQEADGNQAADRD